MLDCLVSKEVQVCGAGREGGGRKKRGTQKKLQKVRGTRDPREEGERERVWGAGWEGGSNNGLAKVSSLKYTRPFAVK